MNTVTDFFPAHIDNNGIGRITCPYCQKKLVFRIKNHEPAKTLAKVICPICSNKLTLKLENNTPATSHLKEGTTLNGHNGTYVLQKVIGHGFMGYTYLADASLYREMNAIRGNQPKLPPIKRKVAVKEFFMEERMTRHHDGTTNTTAALHDLDKFEHEAILLKKMRNEHVVTFYDFFEANGTDYIVMEYLEGGTLADWAASQHTEREILDVVLQIAYGLEYIHKCGHMHLDVKPSNIMRRKDGSWVLVDFGISTDTIPDLTVEWPNKGNAGSLGYAPLEQTSSTNLKNLGPATDIYALGAVQYEMLVGETPPDAYQVFLSGLPVKTLSDKGCSDFTRNIMEHAMQPKYSDRYSTAAEMIDDLRTAIMYLDEGIRIMTMPGGNTADNTIPKSGNPSSKFDNEYDGRTILTNIINGMRVLATNEHTMWKIENVLNKSKPNAKRQMVPDFLLSNMMGIGEIIEYIRNMQSFTSVAFSFPDKETLVEWLKTHHNISPQNPVLCLGDDGYSLLEATIENGRVSFNKAPLFYHGRSYDVMLIAYTPKTKHVFLENRWSFGFHPVCKDGRWGMLYEDGQIALPVEYNSVTPVSIVHIPGPGPLTEGFLGCIAIKDGVHHYIQLSPGHKLETVISMTEKRYNELIDLT